MYKRSGNRMTDTGIGKARLEQRNKIGRWSHDEYFCKMDSLYDVLPHEPGGGISPITAYFLRRGNATGSVSRAGDTAAGQCCQIGGRTQCVWPDRLGVGARRYRQRDKTDATICL